MNINRAIIYFYKKASEEFDRNRFLFERIIAHLKTTVEPSYRLHDLVDRIRPTNSYSSFINSHMQDKKLPILDYIKEILNYYRYPLYARKAGPNDFLFELFYHEVLKESKNVFSDLMMRNEEGRLTGKSQEINNEFFSVREQVYNESESELENPAETNFVKLKAILKKVASQIEDYCRNIHKFLSDFLEPSKGMAIVMDDNRSDILSYLRHKKRIVVSFSKYVRREEKVTPKDVPDHVLDLISKQYASLVSDMKGFESNISQLSEQDIMDEYRDSDVSMHSCMTGENCKYVELYTKNPDKVKLVMYKNETRALLWTCDDGSVVLDRIYPQGTPNIPLLRHWATKNGYILRSNADGAASGSVALNDGSTRYVTLKCGGIFPYADTFKYGEFVNDNHTLIRLSNSINFGNLTLESTSGGRYERRGNRHVEVEEEEVMHCSNCNRVRAGREHDGEFICNRCFEELYFTCNDCGNIASSDDAIPVSGSYSIAVCMRCYENNYFTCEGCQDVYSSDDDGVFTDMGSYCNDCAAEHLERCQECDDYKDNNDFIIFKTMDHDELKVDEDMEDDENPFRVCNRCARRRYHRCSECNEYTNYPLKNNLCFDCAPEFFTGQLKLPFEQKDIDLNKKITDEE